MILYSFAVTGQSVKVLTPVLGRLIDKSASGENKFNYDLARAETVWRKITKDADIQKLSKSDKKIYDECAYLEEYENYWDVIPSGCSWYCGGGEDTATASSELKALKLTNYSASNVDDLSLKSAWIEGVPGYGIGEYVVLHFPPENPRITKIIIVNGYVKSEKIWKENSRVKKFRMYLDNKPFAILNLVDTRQEQTFTFAPIGYANREDKNLRLRPWWTMKFEILEVYPGDKYDDTAISEIYFDGIDVHCFAEGTKILMANKTEKNIESISAGDSILAFEKNKNQLISVTVSKLITVRHQNLVKLKFDDRFIVVTNDHPFYVKGKEWSSINPLKSNTNYLQDKEIRKLIIGDLVFIPTENRYLRLNSIEQLNGSQTTYTIDTHTGDSFIANGLLVKTEKERK